MAIDLSKHNYILENSFKIGFEVECCIFKGKSNAFLRKIKDLNKKITIGSDGSLRPNLVDGSVFPEIYDDSYELGTPPLPSEKAFILLEQIFELVKEFGYTNFSTGFHYSVSPTLTKNYHKINPFYLAKKPIWKQIKKTFKREKNKYCKDIVFHPSLKRNPTSFLKYIKHGKFYNFEKNQYEKTTDYKHKSYVTLWHYLIKMQEHRRFKRKFVKYCWHYMAINLDNYHPVRKKDSRIEIRAMGGKNYHLKLKKIIHYVNRTLFLFKESYRAKQIPI